MISINIAETLLAMLLIANIFLLFTSVIAESYYNLITVGTGFDGWCDKNIYGIGVHCFSDYTLTELIVNEENPWQSEYISPQNYPAAALLISLLFSNIGKLLANPQIGLILYLLTMAICLILPGVWASKGKKTYLKFLIIGMTGIASVPAIMALDRGNSVGFVAPALLMLLVGKEQNKNKLIILSIVLAALVKPQFALLLVLPIFWRLWKVFAYSLIGILATQLLPFFFWPSNFPQTIFEAVVNATSYGGKPDFNTFFPMNSSIASSLFELSSFGNPANYGESIPIFIQQNPSTVSIIVFGCFLVWSFLLRRYFPSILVGIYTIAFVSTFTTVSWSYYLLFSIPIAAIVIRDPRILLSNLTSSFQGVGERVERLTGAYKMSMLLLVIALTFTLSKIIIPNITPNSDPYPFNTVELSTSIWVLGAYISLIIFTVSALQSIVRDRASISNAVQKRNLALEENNEI